MEIKNPNNWTAERSRFVAPTFVSAMGGVRLQDAADATDATFLGSHSWSPPIT
jgi:hypothetical protein